MTAPLRRLNPCQLSWNTFATWLTTHLSAPWPADRRSSPPAAAPDDGTDPGPLSLTVPRPQVTCHRLPAASTYGGNDRRARPGRPGTTDSPSGS